MTPLRLPGIKQGSDFAAFIDFLDDNVPEDFDASELSATFRRTTGEKLCNGVIVQYGQTGRFLLTVDSSVTINWPIGDIVFDVKRGDYVRTDTVVMSVVKPQTL